MNKTMKNTECSRASRILNLLTFVLVTASFLPFLISARYSVFHGDDFGFCTRTFANLSQSLLKACWNDAWDTYTTWQGTWLTNILNPILNPLNWYSYTILRLLLMTCLVVSFLALFFLCHELCLCFSENNKTGILLAVFLLPLLNGRPYYQVYMWHVGAMAYQVPMMLLTLGMALTLRGARRSSGAATASGCVCLFLSGGGVLLIGGFGACLTLLLFLAAWMETGKRNLRYGMAFFAMLLGDLVNVLAPGNYVKAPGELTVFRSILDSLRIVSYEFVLIMSHLVLPIAMLMMLLLGLLYGKRLRPVSFILTFLGLILTPAVTAFPFLLGYDISSPDLVAGRAWFVIDSATVFCSLCVSFVTGGQLCGLKGKRAGRVLQTGTIITATALFLLWIPRIGENMPAQTAINLCNGKIADYNAEWHEIYDMFSMRPGENVVIEWQPDPCVGTMTVSFGAAPDHPNNFRVARYFGNASIVDAWYAATHPEWPGNAVS